MLENYKKNWKNYYEILQVTPSAEPKAITATYERLTHLYHSLPDKELESRSFSARMTDIDEAYKVLSNSIKRAAYDHLFNSKYASQEFKGDEPAREQVVDSMALIALEALRLGTRMNGCLRGWSMVIQRAIPIVLISLLFTIIGGSCFAFAKPDHILATPFEALTITMDETSSARISLIKEIQEASATYEHYIVSTALQSMRVTDRVSAVPVVTTSTNDMGNFPSPEHSLYPGYVVKRFSLFKYTVNSDGVVSVDTSGETTDALFEKIDQLLEQAEEIN